MSLRSFSICLFLLGVCVVSTRSASASILLDTVTTSPAEDDTVFSWSHDVTALGQDRILVVGVSYSGGSGTSVTNCEYGGQALTFVRRETISSDVGVELWYIVNPPTGNNTVTFTLSPKNKARGGAVSFLNVDQATPFTIDIGTSGNSSSPSLIATGTSSEDLVMDVLGVKGAESTSAGSGQTLLWNAATFSDVRSASSTEPAPVGGGDVTMSWSLGSSIAWAQAAFALKLAATTSTTTTSTTTSSTTTTSTTTSSTSTDSTSTSTTTSSTTSAPTDSGDAPSPYPTLDTDDGARHIAVGPLLGVLRDVDADGQPTAIAHGDDINGIDDEDGVTLGSSIRVGQLGAKVMVSVSNAPGGAKLDAWIDFNGDGTWGGPFEQITSANSVTNGSNTVSFDVPSWAVAGNTTARFRISTAGSLGPSGSAGDGEVEDHRVPLTSPTPGDGAFSTQKVISAAADRAFSVFAADVDGDGDMDVLSASNNDGKIAWYENDGSQNFSEHVISSSAAQAKSVFAVDVDGDGDMDVLSASQGDDKIAWYENDGGQNFSTNIISTAANGARSVFVSDVDGDGDMDVLSASVIDDTIAWYENDGSQNFATNVISTAANGAFSVFAADVDGDGDMDVLSALLGDNTIAWYENDGNQNFSTHVINASAAGAISVFAADVDGDGNMDVLSASQSDDTIAWYQNDESQNFTAYVISTAIDGPESVFAADVDGDGDMDVLSASAIDNTIAWYRNDGNQNFSANVVSTTAGGAASVFAADIDGDGDMDVLSASKNDDTIAWYEHVSSTTSTTSTTTTSTTSILTTSTTSLNTTSTTSILTTSSTSTTTAALSGSHDVSFSYSGGYWTLESGDIDPGLSFGHGFLAPGSGDGARFDFWFAPDGIVDGSGLHGGGGVAEGNLAAGGDDVFLGLLVVNEDGIDQYQAGAGLDIDSFAASMDSLTNFSGPGIADGTTAAYGRMFENDDPQAGDWYYVGSSEVIRNVSSGENPPNAIPIGRALGIGGLDPIDGTSWSFTVVTSTTTSTSTTTLTPPVIVNMDTDVTLWSVYTQTGIVTPEYSTNVGTMPIEWLSISVFSNSFVDGTNVFTFAPPDTNAPEIFFQLRQEP